MPLFVQRKVRRRDENVRAEIYASDWGWDCHEGRQHDPRPPAGFCQFCTPSRSAPASTCLTGDGTHYEPNELDARVSAEFGQFCTPSKSAAASTCLTGAPSDRR